MRSAHSSALNRPSGHRIAARQNVAHDVCEQPRMGTEKTGGEVWLSRDERLETRAQDRGRASQAQPAFADCIIVNRKDHVATRIADLIIPAWFNEEEDCEIFPAISIRHASSGDQPVKAHETGRKE